MSKPLSLRNKVQPSVSQSVSFCLFVSVSQSLCLSLFHFSVWCNANRHTDWCSLILWNNASGNYRTKAPPALRLVTSLRLSLDGQNIETAGSQTCHVVETVTGWSEYWNRCNRTSPTRFRVIVDNKFRWKPRSNTYAKSSSTSIPEKSSIRLIQNLPSAMRQSNSLGWL